MFESPTLGNYFGIRYSLCSRAVVFLVGNYSEAGSTKNRSQSQAEISVEEKYWRLKLLRILE